MRLAVAVAPRLAVAVVALVLPLAACGGGGGQEEPAGEGELAPAVRTGGQRDSVPGESALPGVRGVRRARAIADSAEARYRGLDTIGG